MLLLFTKLDSNDFVNAGVLYSKSQEHDKALEFHNKSLELYRDNKYALNNKEFTLNLFNKFEDAILLFNKTIEIESLFAQAFPNRGLAKIKAGKESEGLEDTHHSLKLDVNNVYGYCNLGIYHLGNGEYVKALELFNKAKEFDDSIHMIDAFITKGNL